jgi:hypothetical protein
VATDIPPIQFRVPREVYEALQRDAAGYSPSQRAKEIVLAFYGGQVAEEAEDPYAYLRKRKLR